MINRASNSDQPYLSATPGSAAGANMASNSSGSTRNSKSDTLAFESLETNLGRDTALEVLNSFICFARNSTDELRHCARKQNAEQARSITKELGSSCHVVGASSLLRSCLLLEEELQDPEWQRIQEYIDAVALETNVLCRKMRQLLS